jgi:hypothetical protein
MRKNANKNAEGRAASAPVVERTTAFALAPETSTVQLPPTSPFHGKESMGQPRASLEKLFEMVGTEDVAAVLDKFNNSIRLNQSLMEQSKECEVRIPSPPSSCHIKACPCSATRSGGTDISRYRVTPGESC